MRRFSVLMLMCGVLAIAVYSLQAWGQDAPAGGGGPAAKGDGAGGPPPGPPPGGFHLLPRFVVEKLKLTEDQQKQIADLEKETKEKLGKILTADQKKILEETRPPRRGNGDGPPNGPGGDQGGQGGPGGKTGNAPPPPPAK